jgi:hypothetical protein
MTQSELVQSTFSLPGGKGKYLDTLVEFLTWLEPRDATLRPDAHAWFEERYNAAKSAPYYLPVLRDLAVIELERGKDGAVRVSGLGRTVLNADDATRARLLAEHFVMRFVANREILGVYAEADAPVSLKEVHDRLRPVFPSWTSNMQYEYRLRWMESLGILRCIAGQTFQITDLGRELASKYTPSNALGASDDSSFLPANDGIKRVGRTNLSPLDSLIQELRSASTDSAHPTRFETALAQAFETLGFAVKQLGDSGDTDVLAEAPAGSETYLVVADAKSRGSGKVDQLEVLSLKDHQAINKASYAVVVAGAFAGGKVSSHAADQGITLLPLPVLEDWLRLHDAWPQDLLTYRSLFAIKGLVEKLPADLLRVTNDRKRWGKLLADVVDLFSETYEHGLGEPLTTQDVFKMLVTRKRGVHYPEKDVASIMELLSHPVVGAVARREGGYILVMARETLALRLRRLAEEVESFDVEESGTI